DLRGHRRPPQLDEQPVHLRANISIGRRVGIHALLAHPSIGSRSSLSIAFLNEAATGLPFVAVIKNAATRPEKVVGVRFHSMWTREPPPSRGVTVMPGAFVLSLMSAVVS